MISNPTHRHTDTDIFWGEIAPGEHFAQIYEEDSDFLDTLEGFVVSGLQDGDSVVLIITPEHLARLEDRLKAYGDETVTLARSLGQLITADAEQVLSRFMVNGWPDEERFVRTVTELLESSRKAGRRIRAFGEMVALLWAQGQNGATVRLEHLWHKMCDEERFPLFCAYPKSGFTQDSASSLHEICHIHSRIVGAH